MTIESRDLIVSVSISRNDYYKSKIPNGCRITIAIRRLLQTPKNPESESICPAHYESYTASHNDGVLISEATKKNDVNSRTVNMDHEKLHNRFCVRVHPFQGEKNHFCEELKKSGGEHTE